MGFTRSIDFLSISGQASFRRRTDSAFPPSSGGAVLIGGEGLFSVLTSGKGGLAGGTVPLIVMRVTENSFYVLYIIKEKTSARILGKAIEVMLNL